MKGLPKIHKKEIGGYMQEDNMGLGEGVAKEEKHLERRETNTECPTPSFNLNEGDDRSPEILPTKCILTRITTV